MDDEATEHDAEIVLRRSKYLNNIVEQDYRAIKRIVRPMLGFKCPHCTQILIAVSRQCT
jgi:putative transposase